MWNVKECGMAISLWMWDVKECGIAISLCMWDAWMWDCYQFMYLGCMNVGLLSIYVCGMHECGIAISLCMWDAWMWDCYQFMYLHICCNLGLVYKLCTSKLIDFWRIRGILLVKKVHEKESTLNSFWYGTIDFLHMYTLYNPFHVMKEALRILLHSPVYCVPDQLT